MNRADREAVARLRRDVRREDHAIRERLRQGRASDAAADGGVRSPVREDSVRSLRGLVPGHLQ